MDATSSGLIHFVVVPIQTVVVCIYILENIIGALPVHKTFTHSNAHYLRVLINNGRSLIDDIASWPLVVHENSSSHNTVTKLHEVASTWLERSPLFRQNRDELREYLELLPGFSTNGIEVKEDGTMKNAGIVLLEQTSRVSWYMDWCPQLELVKNLEDHKPVYRSFLTQYMWMRENAPVRMFAKGFSGDYQERISDAESGDVPRKFESLSDADEASTVTMNTPSTTRSVSPAPTKRQDGVTGGSTKKQATEKQATKKQATKKQAIVPSTLKYVAIIETDTDKAIYALEPSNVNEKDCKLMNSAHAMCNAIISKGYGGKVKLQDMMDIAVKMAKK